MKVFLTGGTGFIGSHYLNLAAGAGVHVVAQRRSPASRPRVPLRSEPKWLDKPLDKISADDFGGCDAIVHLAAHTPNPPYDSYSNCMYWNATAACRLFELAARAGITKWVVAGSCFEYGRSGERYDFIPPDAPLEPVASYPSSKAAASIALCSLARESSARLLIGRIFQVYGEGEASTRFWPSLRRAALSGSDFPLSPGGQIRDFVPVEDVAAFFLAANFRDDILPGEPMIENIGSGTPQTLMDFARQLWDKWGASGKLLLGEVPYRDHEVMRYVPLITRPATPPTPSPSA